MLTEMTAGRAIAGVAVGQLTMVVPLYISEVIFCPNCSRLVLYITHAVIGRCSWNTWWTSGTATR